MGQARVRRWWWKWWRPFHWWSKLLLLIGQNSVLLILLSFLAFHTTRPFNLKQLNDTKSEVNASIQALTRRTCTRVHRCVFFFGIILNLNRGLCFIEPCSSSDPRHRVKTCSSRRNQWRGSQKPDIDNLPLQPHSGQYWRFGGWIPKFVFHYCPSVVQNVLTAHPIS